MCILCTVEEFWGGKQTGTLVCILRVCVLRVQTSAARNVAEFWGWSEPERLYAFCVYAFCVCRPLRPEMLRNFGEGVNRNACVHFACVRFACAFCVYAFCVHRPLRPEMLRNSREGANRNACVHFACVRFACADLCGPTCCKIGGWK